MQSAKTRKLTLIGLLFALAIALSYLESLIPMPGIPGIKLGLSNIVTMFCVFSMGGVASIVLVLLKAGFALLTRGVTAATLSAAGGLCAVLIMVLLYKLHISKGMVSVAGAVTHNLGQLAMATFLLGTPVALYYLPILVISGIAMGIITAVILKYLLPVLQRLHH